MRSRKLLSFICFLLPLYLLMGCLKDDQLHRSNITITPHSINDGLSISNPSDENMDSTSFNNILQEFYQDENLWSLRSLLIFRNGQLISESYLKDENDITNRHIIWSCTKQVIGALTGVAIDRGLISNVEDPISKYINLDNHQNKANITIKNLLTMQSGIDYNNDIQTDEILRQIHESSLALILNQPMKNTPGEEFKYNDGNPHLLSAIIQAVSGNPADEFAKNFLFSKLEMTNYNWVRYKDGITLGGFGIETTPRELSKIALCVANNGQWKGEQIISDTWISEMTSVHSKIENSNYSFGYLWWIEETKNIYFMWGVGGQFAFIVPDKNIVVVMTSYPNTKGEYEIQADEALDMVDKIISTAN